MLKPTKARKSAKAFEVRQARLANAIFTREAIAQAGQCVPILGQKNGWLEAEVPFPMTWAG